MGEQTNIAEKPEIIAEQNLLRADGSSLIREWLVTNRAGAYASSSLTTANTRRYHGLLVAALAPPLGRAVLVSKLEDVLQITLNGKTAVYPLSENLYHPDVLYPHGSQLMTGWKAYPVPTWQWKTPEGVVIQKQIWMVTHSNATCISYKVLEAPNGTAISLQLTPLVAWKYYHSEMQECSTILPSLWRDSTLYLTLPPIQNVTPNPTSLLIKFGTLQGEKASSATWKEGVDWNRNFLHPREAERGQDCSEDLYKPGTVSVDLDAATDLVITAAAGSIPDTTPQNSLDMVCKDQETLLEKTGLTDEFGKLLALATDAFVIHSDGMRSTLIAGYPWFADWGRDTMIALPGICLSTGNPDLAGEILRSFAQVTNDGMIPNRFPDAGDIPEYNTVDATLWYIASIWKTLEAKPDQQLLDTLWPVMESIIDAHQKGTRYNIHVDPNDSLLYAGEQGVQLTWMDAKVGDHVITPRIGKPVEINALWYNALCIMAKLAEQKGEQSTQEKYQQDADKVQTSFLNRFVRPDSLGLFDVLDTPYGAEDGTIRPNQVFALSLDFPVVPADHTVAASVIDVVERHLLTDSGLRTLSPDDPAYQGRYAGDPAQRDGAYHQGTAWPWLLGAFAEAVYRVTKDSKRALSALTPLQQQLSTYGMGTLAEIFDGDAPQRPNGCIAQAWSIAETLRVWKLLNGETEHV